MCRSRSAAWRRPREAVALAAAEPDVFATVGVHPHDVAAMRGGRLARAGRAGAPAAGGRHRRDRARLLLQPLAARGCSRPPTGASSRWRARPGWRSCHTSATRTPRRPAILREAAGRRRRHPLLLGRRGRGARLPRPRPVPVVLGHPDLQERGQRARGRRVRAARPHPDRDRRALPGARSPTVGGRTNPPTSPRRWRRSRRCAVCRWPRSTPRPPRTRDGCLRLPASTAWIRADTRSSS